MTDDEIREGMRQWKRDHNLSYYDMSLMMCVTPSYVSQALDGRVPLSTWRDRFHKLLTTEGYSNA